MADIVILQASNKVNAIRCLFHACLLRVFAVSPVLQEHSTALGLRDGCLLPRLPRGGLS